MMSCYYHAGAQNQKTNDVRWSDATRRTAAAAEAEARKMASRHGGCPIVEYWDRTHGLRPGDCEAVAGAYHPDCED